MSILQRFAKILTEKFQLDLSHSPNATMPFYENMVLMMKTNDQFSNFEKRGIYFKKLFTDKFKRKLDV